jgi:hypothetical protein
VGDKIHGLFSIACEYYLVALPRQNRVQQVAVKFDILSDEQLSRGYE